MRLQGAAVLTESVFKTNSHVVGLSGGRPGTAEPFSTPGLSPQAFSAHDGPWVSGGGE